MLDGVFLLVYPPWWVFLVVPSMILTMGIMMWGIMQMTMGSHMASHGLADAPPEHKSHQAIGRSPLDIAKERLAKGEITKEEFDRIRDDLM